MTDLQRTRFYFPAWNLCCRVNGWRMAAGRLQCDGSRCAEAAKVVALALQRAIQAHRPVTLDDLRHAAHILALGRDKSSEHLSNAETDRVVCLFQLLANPEDLTAVMKWQAYQNGEDPGSTRRVEFVIRSIPEALARSIAVDMIGTKHWEDATPAQKAVLARRIAQYVKSKRRPIRSEVRSQKSEVRPPTSDLQPPAHGSYQLDLTKTFVPKLKPQPVHAGGDPDWSVQ